MRQWISQRKQETAEKHEKDLVEILKNKKRAAADEALAK